MLTADTITDEQIMALSAEAQSIEALCNNAMRYGSPISDEIRRKARTDLAVILNARAKGGGR